MVGHSSLFSQLLLLVNRHQFARRVKECCAEKAAKGFSCWRKFVAMMFCQLAQAKSLREIIDGLACCEGKLNHLGLQEGPIADIYRERWQIELFFKALKQNLKIKTFVGTSANAVHIQIWTALIAILLLKILQFKSTFGWALSNLVALLRWNLFSYRDLWEWINHPLTRRPNLRRFRASSSIWTASCVAKLNKGGLFLKNHLPRPPNGLKSSLPYLTNDYFGQQCSYI
jgi:Domain of unknown function (DUF4372)/Transposase DDE domain